MALLFVFSAVALLASIAGALHQTSLSDWMMARREVDRVRARGAAMAAVALAEELLLLDTRPYFWFPEDGQPPVSPDGQELALSELEEVYMGLADPAAPPLDLGGVPVRLRIEDEAAYLNVNRAPGGHLKRLLLVAHVRPTEGEDGKERPLEEFTEGLTSSLEDWRDADENPRPLGAERSEYQREDPAYQPRNGPLLTLSELAWVRGFSDEVLHGYAPAPEEADEEEAAGGPGILPFLTVHGVLNRVNANSALPEVLAATPGIFESGSRDQLVEAIRSGRPYKDRQQLKLRIDAFDTQAGAQAIPWLDIRSDYFRVIATAAVPRSARLEVQVVLRKLPGNRLQRVGYREK